MKNKINFLIALTFLINLLPMQLASAAYDASFILSDDSVVIIENGEYYVDCQEMTTNTIYIANDLTDVTIDIEDLNVRHSDTYSSAPIEIGTGSDVTINFKGDNSLVAYDTAAIQVPEDSSVTINGSGSLRVIGGDNCAGIGAPKGDTPGQITIDSGTYEIHSGSRGAGIGGGYNGDSGLITINGGDLNITSYEGGAAIGSGYGADNGTIIISGGNITATSSDGGAAIGGGYRGKGGNISLTGGTITAISSVGGYAIGSGRYCVGSTITISDDVELSAFSASGIAAVEEDGLTCKPVVFSGGFSGDYFTKDDKFVFTCGSYTKSVTFPAGSREIFTTLNQTGDYTITCSQGNLTHADKADKTTFAITSEYQLFELYSFCACELTAPEFIVDDIIMSKSSTTKSVTLSAKSSEFTLSDSCTEHTSKKPSIKYSYSIIEDRAKIAEISGSRLKITLDQSGTYTVVVRATAYVGTLEAYTDTPITVTRQVDAMNIKDEDIYISENGIYNISGSTDHNAITVAPNLLDVTLVFNNVKIDLSTNAGKNKSPITIGAGSNVSISSTGTSNTLKSKKDANVINMLYNKYTDDSSSVTLRGSGKITMVAKGDGSCIYGEENSEVYVLDTHATLTAIDSPAIICDKFFVSQDANFYARANTNKDPAVSAGFYSSADHEGLASGYLFQGVLGKELDITRSTSIIAKNSDTRKSVSITGITSENTAFSMVLPSDGYYTCSYGSDKKYLTHKDNGENFREFFVDDVNTTLELNYAQCKCKLSAPTFKLDAVTLPYDQDSKSFYLYAKGAVLTVDDECLEHSTSNALNYHYEIIDDEEEICMLDDEKLYVQPEEPGKYKVQIRATASVNGITTSKDAGLSITKLTKEETEKQRGKEHKPYISGYTDGSFRPDNYITRAEASTLLVSALDYDYPSIDTTFTDIPEYSWYYDSVVVMEEYGYLTGYSDGTFRPNNTITRAEFCALICRTQNIKAKSSKSKFSDIDSEHWASGYIAALVKEKAISGYVDDTFRPSAPITRAEAVKIINVILDRTPNSNMLEESYLDADFDDLSTSHWAYPDIVEASARHYSKELH